MKYGKKRGEGINLRKYALHVKVREANVDFFHRVSMKIVVALDVPAKHTHTHREKRKRVESRDENVTLMPAAGKVAAQPTQHIQSQQVKDVTHTRTTIRK